jgi:hypothetical protein
VVIVATFDVNALLDIVTLVVDAGSISMFANVVPLKSTRTSSTSWRT